MYVLILKSYCNTITNGKFYNVTYTELEEGNVVINFIDDDGESNHIIDGNNGEECVLFESEKDLAHYLIDNIEGVAKSLVNLRMSIQ